MRSCRRVVVACALGVGFVAQAYAEVTIDLPLGRTAYQTNELIHLAIVRTGARALPPGELAVTVTGDGGSRMSFAFAVPAVPAEGGDARATEHVYLNGRLMRPGRYAVTVQADGATAAADMELYSHVRRTSFRLVNWGRAKGRDQLCEGENDLGFNLAYAHYQDDGEANFIRAGVDYMRCCTMSGGHQMDLRMECDWSDPYVVRGGVARVVRQALADRTRPNVIGVHFYDEPGLTWHKHPVTGEMTPHDIPSQVRAFRSAFDKEYLPHNAVDPANPEHVRRWHHWARWKLGFMDAAWQMSQWGVSYVRPDYLSVTQSQYGFTAFTDGYYFNVARSLPVVSGHGGYHDWGPGYFNPSYTLEMARARDRSKPCWYLPTWYGSTTSELFRLEQYLSFQTNIQGLISPPDIDPFEPEKRPAAEGVVESNKLMARLGTIFTTMPVTRPPVAMLYSLSNEIRTQTGDMKMNYAHAGRQGRNLPLTYLAGKLMQRRFMPIVEEDVLDGTLAAHHKAVIVTSVDYLDPDVTAALERFVEDGGLCLMTGDCEAGVRGARRLAVAPGLPKAERIAELDSALERRGPDLDEEAKKRLAGELRALKGLRGHLAGASRLARAIGPLLGEAGIGPVFECDTPGIVATREAAGDIEYLFAVNASHDPEGDAMLGVMPVEATISLPDDGRPVYDAVLGGKAPQFGRDGAKLRGRFRFGPGQMRVFARTARPIGGVKAATPVVRRDYTSIESSLVVEVSAVLLDEAGAPLSGSAPLRVRLVDPLGEVRHDLYRATRMGTFTITLPLGLNDPSGEWTVRVKELLANTEDRAAFRLDAPPRCAAAAGLGPRAVYFGRDRDNIFRFFRVHRNVTVVAGSSGYNARAAERLAAVLDPWDVRCRLVDTAEVNRPRWLNDEEARTWVGIEFGRAAPGEANRPEKVGFEVEGPVVLLGTPEDNPLIALVAKHGFLPYAPKRDVFPGRGRGFLAWQRDGVGHGRESVTLIAYGEKGMSEAVGTLYEFAAGIEPLTPLVPPKASRATAAGRARLPAEPRDAWGVALPDRATAIRVEGGALTVLTRDRSLSRIEPPGRVASQKPLTRAAYAKAADAMGEPVDAAALEAAKKHAEPGRLVKYAARREGPLAYACWGGMVRVLDPDGAVRAARQFQHDVTGLVWLDGTLVVGLSDGRVVGLALE